MKLPEELQYIQNSLLPQYSTEARIDKQICVITGTTSGIGYETTKKLAHGGAHLVMICRNQDKAAKVQEEIENKFGVEVEFFIADFQRLDAVARAAREIKAKYPQVHLLINNAGVFNKRRRLTPDGIEMTLGVIHLASFLLTRLLMDNLKQGAPSRVLFISSEAHRFGGFNLNDINWQRRPYIGLRAYAAAKIAQLHTAKLFAEKLQSSGVTVNVIHPGAVKSNIGMNNGLFYRLYNKYILQLFLKDPAQSAEAIYYLAAEPSLAEVTGKFFNQTIEEEPAWYAVKAELSQQVWEKSEILIEPYRKGHR